MTRSSGPDPRLDAFSDRVMAAIALTPSPSPTRSFLVAIRSGSGHDAVAALVVAWHLATLRDWPVTPRVRARSLALVLAVAAILATGSMVAASAARMIVPHVDRTHVFESRGSVILEPTPTHVAATDGGRPQPSVTVPVPGVVSVAVSKKPPVPTGEHTPTGSGTRHTGTGGTTSTHAGDADPGDAGTADDRSDDGDGTHQGDDGAGSGMTGHDGSDAGNSSRTGDDGHDGTDSHQTDDGGTQGD